ncbi:YihY/virulence factor BrkB family protein [Microbacterium sp. LRZ72]|uniref:YihY/virulence factor BrkB family protein n=1 Tax=Microbacterium sp. LRZ72 TaxID=2942481 RepID=UPI0029AFABAE|nr:YihY/virulence factor BrkB family protein [Microbacterium sp. LRZ72]MDX2377896.1 YihY/virulence factor BrkB family protein [Microbacterium sp. LRZ72]
MTVGQSSGTYAPAPEDAAKPNSPGDIDKSSWKYVASRTVREFTRNQCIDIAAALTFFGVLSIFPALLAVFSLLGVFGQGQATADAVLRIIEQAAPGGAADVLRTPIEQIAISPGAGFALVGGVVLAIWTASGYVSAFGRGMNRIYEIEEGRPFWKLKPQQLLVTVVILLLVGTAALLLVVSGPVTDAIGSALGVAATATTVWSIAKWPVLLLIVILVIAILYFATPNVEQPEFRWISFGAVIAIVTLAVASALFALYVANFANYNRTYGSLAGVIVFLLWLWIANLALLFGAEFDAELERARQLQAGVPAESGIRLPPRERTQIEKTQEKEREDQAEGRRIRREHRDGGVPPPERGGNRT